MYLYCSILCFTFALLFLYFHLFYFAPHAFFIGSILGLLRTVGQTDDRQHCELSNRYMKSGGGEGVVFVTEKVPFGSRALS